MLARGSQESIDLQKAASINNKKKKNNKDRCGFGIVVFVEMKGGER
jgi:hypothetical protein